MLAALDRSLTVSNSRSRCLCLATLAQRVGYLVPYWLNQVRLTAEILEFSRLSADAGAKFVAIGAPPSRMHAAAPAGGLGDGAGCGYAPYPRDSSDLSTAREAD